MIPHMPDQVDRTSSLRNRIDPGTHVEVQNAFDRSWSAGFVVQEQTETGYIIRRASDDAVLPRPIPSESVRRQRRNSMWWV
jgi:hypothetical protein